MRLPAIAEADEWYGLRPCLDGSALAANRARRCTPSASRPDPGTLRRTSSEYNFAGQYQQAPSPQGGGMIKAAWFRSYAANARTDKFDHVVQRCDTANKASELSDFSVCTSWASRAKTFTCWTCCAGALNIPS